MIAGRKSTSGPSPGDLLAWYDRHRRDLPWRAAPGARANPYHVWLSEVMLQQTTVATVVPYFQGFVDRWPQLGDLAGARPGDVLHAWQGLGYYARARRLHECARIIRSRHDGRVPDTEAALRALPGIGPYTAAAIAAIAFDRKATVVDGNVERVIARVFGIKTPLPTVRPRLKALAVTLTPEKRPGDYAQAIMELGATVCTPREPACGRCPWAGSCVAYGRGIADRLPRRTAKAARPRRHGVAFWTVRSDGAILLRRRPERGLLGGMMDVPSTSWREAPWTLAEARREAPVRARWRRLPGTVRHGFTHFELELTVVAARVATGTRADGVWCRPERLGDQALATLTKKVISHALDDL